MASGASVVWNQGTEERIPRSFGRLWLLRRLARGGMGEVYLAATSGIEGAERPCVVKIIRRDHAGDRSFLARFFDEARVQAQLQHHGVAQILEASTDNAGEPYVVVEYIEGRSLGEVRSRATHANLTIEWADVVAIGVSLAEALGHVHERTDSTGKPLDIVHRDLSPQNIMLAYGGDLKLIDFGTARAENRRCHTISGVVFAKPGYVAPEVASGTPGDARVDLYALGIILWELLAGRRFLEGDATEHLALVAKDERRPPPMAEQTGAPPELDEVIARLTAHKVGDRYQTAKRVATDLVKLLAKTPALPSGERGVRARVAHMMHRLYPAEPGKSRAEFDSLVKAARWAGDEESKPIAPEPTPTGSKEPVPSPVSPSGSRLSRPCGTVDPWVLAGTRYRILGTIGSGAMGTVYEAQHIDLLRRVALKVLSQERAATGELGASFRREAQAIARVSHPNLVMVHDFGEAADGRPYCAMELLEGETLEDRLAHENRLEWREAVQLGIAACRGLEAAHGVGVVHRDLKPANLFVTKSGGGDGELSGRNSSAASGLKILDFGIAKTSEPETTDGQDGEFTIVGTPEYMAPEQGRPVEVDARADIYALGCVLYELCTGRRPFVANSPVALIEMKSKAAPEPMRVRSRALGLPPSLDRVVMKALAPRADDRYGSAEEFRLALERVLAAPRRRRTVWHFVGYAGIAGAGLFAWTAFSAMAKSADGQPAPIAQSEAPAPTVLELDDPSNTTPPTQTVATATATATPTPTPNATPTANATPTPTPNATPTPTGAPVQHPTVIAHAPPAAPPHSLPAASSPSPHAPLAANTSPHALPPISSSHPPSDPVATGLAAGALALDDGLPSQALVIHRDLAARHPQDIRVVRAWAESAAAAREWKEAAQAAESWALVDTRVDPRLFLARMLVYGGRHRAGVRILESLLEAHPECDEARALLGDYRGADVAAKANAPRAERAQPRENAVGEVSHLEP